MIVRNQHALLHRWPRNSKARRAMQLAVWLIPLVLMTLSTPSRLAAEETPLVLAGPADAEQLGRYFEYTTDPDWQMTIADFVHPSSAAMQPLPGAIPDFGYTPARIWLRLPVLNATTGTSAWRFFIHANFTQKVAVYKIADKACRLEFWQVPLARSPFFVTSMRGAIAVGIEPFCKRLVVSELATYTTSDGFALRLAW